METDQPKVPPIPLDIMDYLQRLYPDKHPGINATDKDIWVKLGQIEVVRHIQSVFDYQQGNLLGEQSTNVFRRR